jgi:pullulanase/glycogen debranching enzyme
VIDPAAYRWRDARLEGLALPGQVLYEMHVGTFTKEGTWGGRARAAALRDLGVTVVEVMPVADFAGPVRLGLRRRRPLRAHAPLRHPGRRCALSWTSAPARLWA